MSDVKRYAVKYDRDGRAQINEVDKESAYRTTQYVLASDYDAVVAERDALRAEVEALRKDAERYRYLREHACRYDSNGYNAESWSTHDNPESLDATIDAAMQSKEPKP